MGKGAGMRGILGVVLVLAGLWGGYWFVGARALDQGARGWIAAQQGAGRVLDYADLSVSGFPNRFDLTLSEPRLEDAVSGLGWQAAFVQVFSLTYKPWHVIAAFAPEQRLHWAGHDATLTADKLQASLIVTPNTALALDRLVIAGDGLRLDLGAPLPVTVAEARLATRADPTRPNGHQVGLSLTTIGGLPALSGVPPVIETISISANLGLTAPLDRFAGQTRPTITSLDLREGLLRWGEVGIFARGSLTTDADGIATGEITLRLEQWRQALNFAAALGIVDPQSVAGLAQAGQFLGASSGTPDVIDLPLGFSARGVTIAGFTVAPPLVLR